MKHLLRQLGFYAFAAWISLTLNFILPRLAPGDPAATMFARYKGQLQPEAMQALRETFGFTNEPLHRQYISYLGHLLHGDFGISVTYFPAKVTDVMGKALGWTALLAGTSVVIAFALGSLLGIAAAWRRNAFFDTLLPGVFVFLGAFPYFWLAMALLYGLGFSLDLFPLRHAYADNLTPEWSFAFVSSVLEHLILPATSIVIASMGGWMLGMRGSMLGVMAEDYMAMAHAKGLSSRRIIFRYAARNALLPNLTGFGMALGFVLGGSLLTEVVFSYPGQGYLLVQAVRNQDYPLMQGIFLTITLAVLGANFLVDLVQFALDPRVRRT